MPTPYFERNKSATFPAQMVSAPTIAWLCKTMYNTANGINIFIIIIIIQLYLCTILKGIYV